MRGEAMTPSCAPLQTEEVETGRGHLDLRGRKSNSKTEKKRGGRRPKQYSQAESIFKKLEMASRVVNDKVKLGSEEGH